MPEVSEDPYLQQLRIRLAATVSAERSSAAALEGSNPEQYVDYDAENMLRDERITMLGRGTLYLIHLLENGEGDVARTYQDITGLYRDFGGGGATEHLGIVVPQKEEFFVRARINLGEPFILTPADYLRHVATKGSVALAITTLDGDASEMGPITDDSGDVVEVDHRTIVGRQNILEAYRAAITAGRFDGGLGKTSFVIEVGDNHIMTMIDNCQALGIDVRDAIIKKNSRFLSLEFALARGFDRVLASVENDLFESAVRLDQWDMSDPRLNFIESILPDQLDRLMESFVDRYKSYSLSTGPSYDSNILHGRCVKAAICAMGIDSEDDSRVLSPYEIARHNHAVASRVLKWFGGTAI